MISLKTSREISLMRKAGEVVAKVFTEVGPLCVPGVSTLYLANKAEEIIRKSGATPTFLNYSGYPGAICVSVNETLVHGIPSENIILKNGDIVSLDVGATLDGYCADACRTYLVGICKENAKQLVKITEECFFKGVSLIKPGIHLGDVSHAIESHAIKYGYSVPKEFTGHGIGTHLHEDPIIPNYGKSGTGPILCEGMCLAIEPMIAEGKPYTRILKDGWTAKMKDGKLSSHYENTLVITKDGYEILTLEKEIK